MSDPLTRLLNRTTYRKIDIENFLDPAGNSWSSFDPELGYLPRNSRMRDGVDGAHCDYTYTPDGGRLLTHYAGALCRINTYGDSFTQCQQVNDGETWQNVLAAHFGEPVRNFGVGGYGVHQAILRARRVEESPAGASHVILTIYDDDHARNLDAARWIRTFADAEPPPPDRPIMLHGIPWSHVRYDTHRRRFVILPSPSPSPEHLRRLCDPQHFCATFQNDAIVRSFLIERGVEPNDLTEFEALASALDIRVNLRDPPTLRKEMRRLRIEYGMRATEFLLTGFVEWLKARGKQLLVVLTYRSGFIVDALEGRQPADQHLLDFLTQSGIPFVDIREVHRAEYPQYRITPTEYVNRFYLPPSGAAVFDHYTPLANAWFAFALKPALLKCLNPPPPAYFE